jgi:hypothetical protein
MKAEAVSSYPLQLPEDLLTEVQQLAAANQTPIDQWLLEAIAEKVGAERSVRLMQECAKKADYDRFDQILARVPDVEPIPGDELGT